MSEKQINRLSILILTSEYPNPNSTYDTPVVHFFAREWEKSGYNVRVIHYRSTFPRLFYWISSIMGNLVRKIFKTDFIPTQRIRDRIQYNLDGVLIFSEPIFKLFPHIRYSKAVINLQLRKIIEWNKLNSFTPDIIIGHFLNPQLILIPELKKNYPKSVTSLVFHENPLTIKKVFKKDYALLLRKIDFLGFRYLKMKEDFLNLYGNDFKTFICPSGIPEKYIIKKIPTRNLDKQIIRFCYAGMLIPLKNVSVTIDALILAFPNRNFEFTIIGKGMLESQLKAKVHELGLDDIIKFKSHLSRDEVQALMELSDCFVMVSEPEAFGLVYLEAMAKGCITIGTKGQGIDGVILNGYNGFLCSANNVNELSNIFKQISSMSSDDLINIKSNAIMTAREMTDEKVAKLYLENLNIYSPHNEINK